MFIELLLSSPHGLQPRDHERRNDHGDDATDEK
jgi:hypothetical protein